MQKLEVEPVTNKKLLESMRRKAPWEHETFHGEFRPTARRLKDIAKGCAEALVNESEEGLG